MMALLARRRLAFPRRLTGTLRYGLNGAVHVPFAFAQLNPQGAATQRQALVRELLSVLLPVDLKLTWLGLDVPQACRQML